METLTLSLSKSILRVFNIMRGHDHGAEQPRQQPLKVGAILDSGSMMSCVFEKRVVKLGTRFDGTQMAYPMHKNMLELRLLTVVKRPLKSRHG